jgi:hypothetical protein
MQNCPICGSKLKIQKCTCEGCKVEYSGDFQLPRLARLGIAHQLLAEKFLITGGNLKELAQMEGITYPTLRKQVDVLIEELKALKEEDNRMINDLLEKVEKGELPAEAAERLIKEINGDA